MVNTIVGLDLAATLKDNKVGVAILERKAAGFALASAYLVKHTSQIMDLIHRKAVKPPVLMAIDAPLRLPLDNEELALSDLEARWPMVYTYRPWEYLVFQRLKKEYAVSGRPFSSLTITYRGQILKRVLEGEGWQLISSPSQISDRCFTEVFPNLTMGILMKPTAGDDKDERRRRFVTGLFGKGYHGIALQNETGKQLDEFLHSPDMLDAIICAWTGCLFAKSRRQPRLAICLGDETFGFVICPYSQDMEAHLNNVGSPICSHIVF